MHKNWNEHCKCVWKEKYKGMCQQSNMRMEMSTVKWKKVQWKNPEEFKGVKCNKSMWGMIQSNCDENSKSVLKKGKRT